tara:strand:+ start:591 stop:2012 length:1422 start_codon:yes stop_codon:yes gene_type:complete
MIELTFDKNKIRLKGEKFNEIRDHFSIKDETARFRLRGRARFYANPKIYGITPTGLFEEGMFYDIVRYIKETYPNEELNIDPIIPSRVKPTLSDARVYDNLTYKLRDYQEAACEKAITFGRGILKMGTGAGKTLTICSLLMSMYLQRKNNLKCLLIVPDLGLVNQTYKDFVEYNALFKFTKWTGSIKPDLTADVIIANLGILQSQFKDNDWLKDVDVVVVDECHKVKKSNKVSKMIQSIRTVHKFGLTGTLPDHKPDEWNLVGKIGSVIYEKDSFSLRTEKHLTIAKASIVELKYKTKPKYISGQDNYRNELDFIYNNPFRNKVINQLTVNFKNNILILVNHIAHGDALLNELQNDNKQVYFVKGEVEVEERDRIKKVMEDNSNVICVAMSSIFSTGINIKNIHMIVFAAGGKSSIRTIQSIGRGLRLHDSKDKLSIIDLADQLKYGERHVEKRKEIYTQEKIPYSTSFLQEK